MHLREKTTGTMPDKALQNNSTTSTGQATHQYNINNYTQFKVLNNYYRKTLHTLN
jgi:hypothetical protein